MEDRVTLGGAELALVVPRSMSARYEVAGAALEHGLRAGGAALGLCWGGPNRPTADYARCRYDPLKYGGAVMDDLLSRGHDLAEIATAGRAAYLICTTDLVSSDDVDTAEDFTDPAGAGSTG